MKVFVQFSGGKDSQACLIWACEKYGNKHVTAIFCDTGWEHELTYKHVNDITSQMGVELVVLKNERVDGMVGLCKRARWFPDTQKRMCTVQLKIQPNIDFVLQQDDNVMLIQGIRAAESVSRSKLSCSGDYFAEYKIPAQPDEKPKRLYRKKDVLKWCDSHDCIVDRPMFGMSAQSIIDYILDHGQQPNPLYRRGCSRVGCYPCIYSKLSEIKAMASDEKYVARLVNLEQEVNSLKEKKTATPSTFFPKGKIPNRFCTTYGSGIATFGEIVAYVKRDDAQLKLFEPEGGYSCMSMYHGLCE